MPRPIDQLRSKVRQGRYVLTRHALEEMAADGLEEDDVEQGILSGRVIRRQQDHLGRRKYTVEGNTTEGRRARIVCRLSDFSTHVVVITVYEVEEG